MKPTASHFPHLWIPIILAGGFLYLLYLTSLAPDGVYFSGDSGLKSIATQNLAIGSPAFDLNLPDPPWIKKLWEEGMFPYGAPFVYRVGEKYFLSLPYTFSLINAPFYAAFGYRGLYVVPFLSTVVIWLMFLWVCKKLGFHPIASAIGLFFLIFSTNLTLFGALNWEHTLSVCLAFAGLSLLIPQKGSEHFGAWSIAGSGILTGLSVGFRPEQIFLVLYLDLIALFSVAKATNRWRLLQGFDLGKYPGSIGKKGWIYHLSSTATLLFYGFTNWLVYKNFFGVHAIQVLEPLPLIERLKTFVDNLLIMSVRDTSFLLFNPVVIFLAGFIIFGWVRRGQVMFKRDWTIWLAFCFLFLLGVAALVPPGAGGKQWGPRFLLLLVPLVMLIFTSQIDQLLNGLKDSTGTIRRAAWGAILIVGIAGIIQNPLRGRDYIIYNYNLVKPAVEALRADPSPLVAVSSYHLSQVFQPALGREVFFLAVTDENRMVSLSTAWLEQGQDTFTYICYSFDCKLFKPDDNNIEVEQNGIGYSVNTLTVKDYGKYTIRKVRVSPVP